VCPIGAGPYKFVLFTPGVELLKRLVLRMIPDEAMRLPALKSEEIDIAYSIGGELAEKVQHPPGLALKPVVIQARFGSTSPTNARAGADRGPRPIRRPRMSRLGLVLTLSPSQSGCS
jgi:ABC-type transport system substrate-binding protein